MIVQRTSKAEVMLALALYCGYNESQLTLLDRTSDRVFAVGGWAPLEVFLIINVGPCQKRSISVVFESVHTPINIASE
jgi:hypothetical protein